MGMPAALTSDRTPLDDTVVNRELSWLAFNDRVLQLASEPGIPLLERAKFCAITTTNLDEFFQVRVAALKDQVAAGHRGADARRPHARPAAAEIGERARQLVARQEAVFLDELVPGAGRRGRRDRRWSDVDAVEQQAPDARSTSSASSRC